LCASSPSTRNARIGSLSGNSRRACSAGARDPESIDELEQALVLDPNFTEAWWLSSVSHTGYAVFVDPAHADEHRKRGEEAARRAIELDPQLGEAHAALALVLQGKRSGWPPRKGSAAP
jgi:hypothetical protein